VATWALPATTYAAANDLLYSTWVQAWDTHALVTAPSTLAQANIYHPTPDAWFYGPTALGAVPLFAPVFLLTGNPTLAVNFAFLMAVGLLGTTTHEVVRRWTGSELAGFIAATTVLANQWLLWNFVPTTPHLSAIYLLPVIAFIAATRLESTWWAIGLVPLIVLQSLTEPLYVAPAVLGPLGVLAVGRLVRRATRPAGLRLAGVLALVVLALVPMLRGYLRVRAANPALATQTPWVITEASIPYQLPARLFAGSGPLAVTPVAMGLIAAGAVTALWRRRNGGTPPRSGAWAHGVLWTVVGACMAQTATVWIQGRLITTPMGLVEHLVPVLRTIRVPSRLGIAGLVGLGILSGVAFAELTRVVRARVHHALAARLVCVALAAVVASLVYRAYVRNYVTVGPPRPMPASYPVYAAPAIPTSFLPVLQSSRTPLLELPVGGPGRSLNAHAVAMYHSIFHWRPLVNGYSSYWPAGFPQRMALAARLPDPAALDELVRTTGLALIWVHGDRLMPAEGAAWITLITPPKAKETSPSLRLLLRERTDFLFAVTPPSGPATAQ
jgi:hypothetical protein